MGSPYLAPSYGATSYIPPEIVGGPPTTRGLSGPYGCGDYYPRSYLPGELVGAIVPTLYYPVIFEVDLETYLAEALGVPIWAGVLPASITQGGLPALVYNLITSESEVELDGPTDIDCWNVQFDAYGKTRLAAATLVERLRSKILGYSGMMGATEVLNVALDVQSHAFEELPSKSALAIHRRMATYTLWYRNSIPSFG